MKQTRRKYCADAVCYPKFMPLATKMYRYTKPQRFVCGRGHEVPVARHTGFSYKHEPRSSSRAWSPRRGVFRCIQQAFPGRGTETSSKLATTERQRGFSFTTQFHVPTRGASIQRSSRITDADGRITTSAQNPSITNGHTTSHKSSSYRTRWLAPGLSHPALLHVL